MAFAGEEKKREGEGDGCVLLGGEERSAVYGKREVRRKKRRSVLVEEKRGRGR